jgi:glycyl-tRNA synthetase (class II)
MKTQFTMSVEEAEQRLRISMADVMPYNDNEISVKIVLPDVAPIHNLPLNCASKIDLIKLVRKLSDDLIDQRLNLSAGTIGSIGKSYLGLADAKAYVENFIKSNCPPEEDL